MNKKVKSSSRKKFFDWRLKRRINRLEFLKGFSIVWCGIILIGVLMFSLLDENFNWIESIVFVFLALVIFLLVLAAIFSLKIKRGHDLNWSGWSILWSFVPIASLIYLILLFTKRGTIGKNRFDSDSFDSSDFTICSSCGSRCDDLAFECPNCGEKFWQSRKDYEKFLKSRKVKK